MANSLKILRIDASGRQEGSSTRDLLDDLCEALALREGDATITRRDLADSLPHVDDAWIGANFTAAEDRSPAQQQVLELSDKLVAELQAADTILIGMPIYNFGVPAALKAWVDMIARARVTFRYTENGPVGLLDGKKVYLVVASGGVGVDSAADFATPYMRYALQFVGLDDIDVIAADQQGQRGEDALSDARAQIAALVHTGAPLTGSPQAA